MSKEAEVWTATDVLNLILSMSVIRSETLVGADPFVIEAYLKANRSVELIGVNEDGNLYRGTAAFDMATFVSSDV